MNKTRRLVGVIGAGNFGTTIASLLSIQCDVLLYTRSEEQAYQINTEHRNIGYEIPNNIVATTDFEEIAGRCNLIIPVVPSQSFRQMIRELAPFVKPSHIVIHSTKGFDLKDVNLDIPKPDVSRNNIRTMSEVITEETTVVRVGCISGPNLSEEIMSGLPAATVIASEFDEVIVLGYEVLSSPRFKVYGSHSILATELAGGLKNMIAIGTGIIKGMEMGKNLQALFITRGLREMMIIGKLMGADTTAFMGTAGIGDLIATATGSKSRNFQFGLELAKGKTREEIEAETTDLAEGVRTVKLIYFLAQRHEVDVPIIQVLYLILYEGLLPKDAIQYLIEYPYSLDVDF